MTVDVLWIIQIIGWLWILLGVWWFFRPQGIRKRLGKGFERRLRTLLLLILFTFGGVLIAAGSNVPGVGGYVVIAVGVIALLKGLLFVRGKVSEPVLTWWARQSNGVYRGAALGLAALGFLIQWIA